MFCIYCGKNIKDGSSFCPYCGKQLHPKKEASNSATVPPPVAAPRPNVAPVSSGRGNYQQAVQPNPQNRKKKSHWGLKLLLWLLACIIVSLAVVCALVYYEIVQIPVVGEIMTEIGITQDSDRDEDVDAFEPDENEDEVAQTTEAEEETTPPTTEDPAEVAYREAVDYCAGLADLGDYDSAVVYLEELSQQSTDSRYTDLCKEYRALQKQSLFATASDYASEGKYRQAIQILDAAWTKYGDNDYYDTIVEYRQQFGVYNTSLYAVGKYNTMLLSPDGSVEICGDNSNGELSANYWTDIIAVSAGDRHVVGLKKDGTVVADGEKKFDQCDVSGWKNIVAISAGDVHTVALSKTGTIYATGYNHKGQLNVNSIMSDAGDLRIVSVAAGYVHTLALLENGRVAACGSNSNGECNVSGWTDIVAIYAGTQFSAGLKVDGTVVVTGQGVSKWDLTGWTDIVNLAAGDYYLIGLKADGTVLSAGVNSSSNPSKGQTDVAEWTDIVFVGAGNDHSVAMNSDGTLSCIGSNKYGQCNYDGRTLER